MTDISGASSQGYTTYMGYKKINALSNKIVFLIPVYNNIPDNEIKSVLLTIFKNQFGKVKGTSELNIRKGPSADYDSLGIKLPEMTVVKVLGKCRTDSNYYINNLYYPYWYNVRYKSDGKDYTGYVCGNFIEMLNKITLNKQSKMKLRYNFETQTSAETPVFVSKDSNVASVDAEGIVKAVFPGKTSILVYTMGGGIDFVNVVVRPDKVSAFKFISDTKGSITLSWKEASKVSGYTIYQYDTKAKKYKELCDSIKNTTTINTTIDKMPLIAGINYKYKVKSYIISEGERVYGLYSNEVITTVK
jgi:hypothetical protein